MLSAAWRRAHPYLLLTILALPALWPLAGPGLPRTNDALPHLYRAVELDALVRAGLFFPRWAPDLVHGYGYPVFNFFPYLSHYLVVLLHLAGFNFLTAYNLACGLALLASGFFAYRLGRAHFGPTAGLVAGVAYLYSPYLLYDTYIRGSLPESVALALLPLIFYYLRRAAHGHRPAVAQAALALAAALLAHNGVMLQAMPFLLLYFIAVGWIDQGRKTKDERRAESTGTKRKDERQVIGVTEAPPSPTPPHPHTPTRLLHRLTPTLPHLPTFILAFLLTAFFTLPALAEARYAQIARGTGSGGMSYLSNFLTLAELFALPRLPVDPTLLNPPVVRSLPLAALALAAITGLRWLYQRLAPGAARPSPAHTRALIFFALAALTATLLIHPLSRPHWDNLPLLKLTLFPWRLLGPTSLFIALLAGALFADDDAREISKKAQPALDESVVRRLSSVVSSFILPLSSFILILHGLPFATPPRESLPPAPSLADLARFEVPPTFIGTTTVGEYLPLWVRALPDTAPNRDQLLAGQPVQRHEAPGAEVSLAASRPTGDSYTIEAPAATTFLYRAFYFPGWTATLDGQPVPITITHPEGLITVAVPEGTHTLSFHFGLTPVRVVGVVLSFIGLILTAALLLLPIQAQSHAQSPISQSPPFILSRIPRPVVSGILGHPSSFILSLLLVLSRPLLYDAGRTPLLQRGPRPTVPLHYDYAAELTLLGLDASTTALPADDELRVDLYWLANHSLGIPYGFDVRLVDAAGHTWSQPDLLRPRDWRFTPGTDFWPTDQYILDPYLLRPIPGTPPGHYQVRVNLFAWPTLQSIATHHVLDVTITAPSRDRACALAAMHAYAWDGALLTSTGFSTHRAAPGDDVVISPCWQAIPSSAERAPRQAMAAELRLLDRQGQTVVAQPFTPGGGAYPAQAWQPGDTVLDQVDVRLPAALPSGDYTWALSVNGSPPYALGPLTVKAPERTFTAPPVATVLNASLGPVTLHGLSAPLTSAARGAELPLTLVWRANTLLPDSYLVFVHLLAPDGSLAAQSDGVPAAWTRRTTGWLPGEFITDPRPLFLRPDLPPGTYTLWAGFYAATTSERLVTDDFPDGRVAFGEIVVE